MKRLRFVCFASLLALILLAGAADQGGTRASIEAAEPPTPVDQAGNETPENRHGSGSIMITMTGVMGDEG
jgi:hypothetical protein